MQPVSGCGGRDITFLNIFKVDIKIVLQTLQYRDWKNISVCTAVGVHGVNGRKSADVTLMSYCRVFVPKGKKKCEGDSVVSPDGRWYVFCPVRSTQRYSWS